MSDAVLKKAIILVADDDPDFLKLTARVLNRSGYEVLTAKNGEVALKAFREARHAIHMVISDVAMPAMRGPQLVHCIKSLSPSTATLLMSGTWGIARRVSSPSIEKPFRVSEFIDLVRQLLAHSDFARIELEQSVARSRHVSEWDRVNARVSNAFAHTQE
jgi:DNA-binding NtrC family response regulator